MMMNLTVNNWQLNSWKALMIRFNCQLNSDEKHSKTGYFGSKKKIRHKQRFWSKVEAPFAGLWAVTVKNTQHFISQRQLFIGLTQIHKGSTINLIERPSGHPVCWVKQTADSFLFFVLVFKRVTHRVSIAVEFMRSRECFTHIESEWVLLKSNSGE